MKMKSKGSMPRGTSGGTSETKITTGPASAMLGKHMPPPSDPTYTKKSSGTDMKSAPALTGHRFVKRDGGFTEHMAGSEKC